MFRSPRNRETGATSAVSASPSVPECSTVGNDTHKTMPDNLEFEADGDELDDREYPEPDDEEDLNDQTETVPCPECGCEVYEDAGQCPACGAYIAADANPWYQRPLWWILLGLAGIGATLYALVGVR